MNKIPRRGHGFIYKYTSPSGKSYIGQTIKSLEERARNGNGYLPCKLFYSAIKKYGFNNFEVEILGEFLIEQLDELEKRFIEIYNTLAPSGYNILVGGKTANNAKKVYQYDEETGYLLREYPSVQDAANAISVQISSLSNCLNGYNKKSANYFWSFQKLDKYPVLQVISNREKEVLMFNLDGELIRTFSSLGKAALFVNGERSAIKRCCRKELKTAYGYKWECIELLNEKKYNNTPRSIKQLDINSGEIIHIYPSISSAAKAFKKNGTSNFRKALNNPKYTAYGYKWEYT